MKFDKRTTLILLGGAAFATGLGAAAYYHYFKDKCSGGSDDAVEISVELEETHVAWLKEKADQYCDGDINNALKTVLSHCLAACSDPKVEEDIFVTVRCNTCGAKSKTDYAAKLDNVHVQFVKAMTAKHSIDTDSKTFRVIMEYAQNDADVAAIFS